MFQFLTRFAPVATIGLLILPVLAGLAGTVLPALNYLPAAGLHDVSLAPFAALLSVPGLWRSCFLSIGTGLLATIIACAAAFLVTGLFVGTRVFAAIRHMISPLLAVPHAAAAFGLAALIAPSGMIVRLFSPWATGWVQPPDLLIINDPHGVALTMALVAKEMPFLVLMIMAALPQSDAERRLLLTRSLGYGRLRGFAIAVLPGLYGQIRLAVAAVLVYGVSNVDMAMILGPTTPPTLSVLALRLSSDPDLTLRTTAAAAALLQALLALLAVFFWFGAEWLAGGWLKAWATSGRRGGGHRGLAVPGLAAALYPAVAVLGGLVVLSLWSLAGPWRFPDVLPSSFTLASFMNTAPMLLEPVGWSLALGGLAALLATILVLLCLEREDETGKPIRLGLLIVLYAPLLVPQIAFLFGISTLAVMAGIDGAFGTVLLAHLIFVIPYVYLSLQGPYRVFDTRLSLVARSLGASRARVFFMIRLPILLRPVLTAMAVGFSVSVAQYLPTLLIAAGRFSTVTTEAVALSSGQDRRVIGVVALVQTLLPALAILAATLVPALLHRNRRGLSAGDFA